ncbi:cupin domain-containing protein [Phenylobacterium sp.]|uniref:cupin domain-containing protein n=1 Tax=Phenylobacterium sp. TaxID=1871053 RepID=UPI002DE68956|nr:cupin domain-containing protein [Phenylobacterium sp.]
MTDIAISAIDTARLEPAPIRPEWIVSGDPQARCAELSRSGDGLALSAVWDCTAGEFDWTFGGDETVHILQGEVVVQTAEGPRTLRPGDVALFAAGSTCRWRVPVYVKKLAFCREPTPRAAVLATQALRRLKRLVRPGAAPVARPLAPAAA